ncbi:MAG: hypothetical protein ACE1ZO_05230, partial [Nitrospirales bacterium]
GRSPFDARSVLIVREHGKRARTPLAAFFNIPTKDPETENHERRKRMMGLFFVFFLFHFLKEPI